MNIKSAIITVFAMGIFVPQISAEALPKEKAKKEEKKKFIDQANMDLSVKPGDDFYTYASGNWIKNNPVPAKETSWGSFMELVDFNNKAVKSILSKAEANKQAPPGSIEKRVGDFYTAAMDTIAIEKLGYTPIKADLDGLIKSKI
jgi:putative endopeptidase